MFLRGYLYGSASLTVAARVCFVRDRIMAQQWLCYCRSVHTISLEVLMLKLLSQIPRIWHRSTEVAPPARQVLGQRELAPAASAASRAPTSAGAPRQRAQKLSATALTPAPVAIREKMDALRALAPPQSAEQVPAYQQALTELDDTIKAYQQSSPHPDPDCRVGKISQMQEFRALLGKADSATLEMMLQALPADSELNAPTLRHEVHSMLTQCKVADTCAREVFRITSYLHHSSPINSHAHRMLGEVDRTLATLAPLAGQRKWTFDRQEQRVRLLKQLAAQPAAKLRAMAAAWGPLNLAQKVDPDQQPVRAAILDALRAHQAKYPQETVAEAAMVDAIRKFSRFGRDFLLQQRPPVGIDPQAQLINQLNALNLVARAHLHHLPFTNALLVDKTEPQPAQAARSGQIIHMEKVIYPPPAASHPAGAAAPANPLGAADSVWDVDAMVSLKQQLNDILRRIPLAQLDAVVANWQAEKKGFDIRHNAVRHLVFGLAEERHAIEHARAAAAASQPAV